MTAEQRATIDIVIPAYRALRTLPSVLDALVPQAAPAGAQIVVVDSSADDTAAVVRERWPDVVVVELAERTLPGPARNLGAERGDAELLVFLDADATPAPGWLDGMVAALGPDDAAVAGAMANGTPSSPSGTAGWLLEFSNWLPGAPPGAIDHAASASLLVRRHEFVAAGGFPVDIWPGEDTVLTHAWGSAGTLRFAPEAVVSHRNRRGLRPFLDHQRLLGIAFAHVCARCDFAHGRFGRRPWALAAGGLRVAALSRRLWRRPRLAIRAVVLAPWLLAGLVAWTRGLWAGTRLASPDPGGRS